MLSSMEAKMSDLARELRRIIDLEGVCATAADRIEELEAEVERLRESIAQFVYANDTEVSDDRPITPEEWEADWETAMSGLRAALAGEGGET